MVYDSHTQEEYNKAKIDLLMGNDGYLGLQVSLDSIEYRLKKHPIIDPTVGWRCPYCRASIEGVFEPRHCEWCGQALDWTK